MHAQDITRTRIVEVGTYGQKHGARHGCMEDVGADLCLPDKPPATELEAHQRLVPAQLAVVAIS